MHTVTLRQNNSGGYFWLSQEQFDALVADGWRPDPNPSALSFRTAKDANLQLDVPVADEDAAVTIAEVEFQRVTGLDPHEIGCTCCGPPFSFDTWHDRWPDDPDEAVRDHFKITQEDWDATPDSVKQRLRDTID